eukprot:TRINITY_DN9893_c0_g2_i1.p1 TRINITY_DN9893_c0_g2~~TRINITY_DN9893_c0_g2_i1.p1  ORF type:complete len:356 (-),score=94.32 TRINITY_DN9893_c0_g2_i1:1097-2164(-)
MAAVCDASLGHSCAPAAPPVVVSSPKGQAPREILDMFLLGVCFILGCMLFKTLRSRFEVRVARVDKSKLISDEKDACESDCVTCCPSDNSATSLTSSLSSELDDGEKTEFVHEGTAAVDDDMYDALDAAISSGNPVIVDAILKSAVHLCNVTWITGACARLRDAGIPSGKERALEFVRTLALASRADLAVELWQLRYKDSNASGAFEEDLYGAVLDACASSDDFEAASQLAKSAAWRAPAASGPGLKAWLGLVRWFARRGVLGPALQCYEAARSNGAVKGVDLVTHKTILEACIASNDMTRAEMLFQDLLSHGAIPDVATLAAMQRGHRAVGNEQEAASFGERLRQNGMPSGASR